MLVDRLGDDLAHAADMLRREVGELVDDLLGVEGERGEAGAVVRAEDVRVGRDLVVRRPGLRRHRLSSGVHMGHRVLLRRRLAVVRRRHRPGIDRRAAVARRRRLPLRRPSIRARHRRPLPVAHSAIRKGKLECQRPSESATAPTTRVVCAMRSLCAGCPISAGRRAGVAPRREWTRGAKVGLQCRLAAATCSSRARTHTQRLEPQS